ncbi:MAG: excinuclease ABC subunit UvrC [Flavobacteriales bacterium]
MINRKIHIKTQLKLLSVKPGVYQFIDKNNKIIYIGKAKNLKNRVGSYFSKQRYENGKTAVLVSKITDIKTIVTNSEMEALLLENNLIKEYKPKYNIQLKDDKTYPWICIKHEPFSRIFYTRNLEDESAEYFGPFHSVKLIKTMLELFHSSFGIRNCSHRLTPQNIGGEDFKTSVEYYIGNCKGCCQGEITTEQYEESLQQIREIIRGNISLVIRNLKSKMTELAGEYKFEEAQQVKDKISIVEKYQAKTTIVNPNIHNVDVYSIKSDAEFGYVNYMRVMNGAIVQSHNLELKKRLDETDAHLLEIAIAELRTRFKSESKEILVSEKLALPLEGVKVSIPMRGDKKALLEFSEKNAKYFRAEKYKQEKIVDPDRHARRILEGVKKDLRLQELPYHIECFDNSNIHGTNPVSACVVFKNAKPSKKDYRHFNIKTVVGPNDFASMEEAVYRRYKRLMEEGDLLPQLIVIDGGKGQLSSAIAALSTLGLRGKISVIGIAKKLEEIYFPEDPIPLYIDKKSETLKLIQFMRNEAHRFGITHHRNRRSKTAFRSELLDFKGIGEKTLAELLKSFKTVKAIKSASLHELQEAIGTNKGRDLFEQINEVQKPNEPILPNE